MRIVDVAAFYTPEGGGVKTYIDRKLIVGPAAGHEIVVIAPGREDRVEERGPNARIIYLKAPQFPIDRKYHYFRDEVALHAALDAADPDLIEASSPWRSARLVGEWPGAAPRVLVMHADPLSAFAYRWFGKVASRDTIDRGFGWFWQHLIQLDALFLATITAGEDLTHRLEVGGMTNLITNPMGVTGGIFSPMLRDEGLRARLLERCDLGSDATLLLAAGRLAPEKRWPMVIEAVTAAGAKAPVGLILVGDGRWRARVARAASDNPHIHLISPIADRPELARLFASADALIHGCEAETFCMVAAEARASGLPLIAPDGGGAADQARQANGWLYAPGDPGSAAEAIERFVAAPRADVRARAVAAAPNVRTMDEHFDALFAYYETLVGSRRKEKVAARVRQAPVIAAIELGGTKVNVGVGNHPDQFVETTIIPTTTPAETLAAVTAFLQPHAGRFAAIGVASFGPVALDPEDVHWGSITATNKPHWSGTPIASSLARAFQVPIAFDTDVNGAALGEYRWGALAGARVGLYLTVGTGVGGGVLIDGRPLHGLVHPEMGHIRLKRADGDRFAGVCAFHGDCLEGLVAGPAIATRLGMTLSEVRHDHPARAQVIDDIGQGVASLVAALSPDRIVIGGGVAKTPGFHAAVVQRMRHWLGGYVVSPALERDGYLVPPQLGDRAGLAGGIALAHDLLDRHQTPAGERIEAIARITGDLSLTQ